LRSIYNDSFKKLLFIQLLLKVKRYNYGCNYHYFYLYTTTIVKKMIGILLT